MRTSAALLAIAAGVTLAACGTVGFDADTSCRDYRESARDPDLVAARMAFEGDVVAKHPADAETRALQTKEAGTLLSHLGEWCAERPDDTLAEATTGAVRLHRDAVLAVATSDAPGVDSVRRLLAGIPQDGTGVLGKPEAPVTIAVFFSVDCPFCANWLRDDLPALIDTAVRPGKARLRLVPSDLPDSFADDAANPELDDWTARHVGWNAAVLLAWHRGEDGTEWFTRELQDLLMGELSPMVPKNVVPTVTPGVVDGIRDRANTLISQLRVERFPSFFYGSSDAEPETYVPVPDRSDGSPDFERALRAR